MFKTIKKYAGLLLGVAVAAFATAPARATYATADAVVTAVNALPGQAEDTFLASVVIGMAVLTISVVVYVLRKGIKLR